MAAGLAIVLVTGLLGVMGMPGSASAGAGSTATTSRQAAVNPIAPEAGQFYATRGRVVTGLKIAKGATATVDATGVAGVPASGVASVALNFAVRGETAGPGQLIIYPSGAAEPDNTTAIRYRTTIFAQNLITAKLGADGKVKVHNDGPVTAIVYADAHGYTLSAAGAAPGLTYVPLKPARIAFQTSIAANGNLTLAPLGKGGIPLAGVSHAAFTINARSATDGKLTVYPSGTAKPADTNLDYGENLWFQNQVFAKLGTDGKVIINNAGTKPVAVDVHVTGYFATPQAAVAGSTFQPLPPARLAGFVNVAANATYTVAPLGRDGVPATGVSAVAVNITTKGTTAQPANVRVYPSGTSDTDTHAVAVHPNDQHYSGFLSAKLGADGKVTILNDGPSTTVIWVDVFGYFRFPSGCASSVIPAEPTQGPALGDPESYSPTAVFQASPVGGWLGTIELAYGDNFGRLFHGHIEDPGNLDSVQWTAIHEGEAFTGKPGLSEEADGRLHVVGHNVTSDVWTRSQATRSPPVWGSWRHAVQTMGSHAAVVRHDDTVVSFAISTSGRLRALPQYSPNVPGDVWFDLGLGGLSTATAPVVVPVGGGLQVFALDTAGTWRTARYAHGIMSGCTSLAGSGFTMQPSVVVIPGGRMRIFARAADGHIMTMMQDTAGSWPQAWDQVGDLVAAGSPSALLSPGQGRIEVVARGTDGVIYSTGETAQASGVWRAWKDTRKEGDTFIAATDPTAFEYVKPAGPSWAFVARDKDNRTRTFHVDDALAVARGTASPTFVGRTLPTPAR